MGRQIAAKDVNPIALGRIRVGAIGDSICASLNANAWFNNRQYNLSDAPLCYAMLNSVRGWRLIVNAGVAGQRSDQIQARFQSDLLAAGVDVAVICSCYWNDVAQGYTAAFTVGNIQTMCQQAVTAGALPLICLPTPDGRTGSSSARLLYASTVAASLRAYAKANGFPLCDMGKALVDPATGTISATYNNDGSVHPVAAGFAQFGAELGRVLDLICTDQPVPLVQYAVDQNDLLGGAGLFLTNSSGVGTGWSYTSTSGATASIITDSNLLGNSQQIACSATSGSAFVDKSISSGWSAGDYLELAGVITYDGGAALPRIRFVYGGSPSPNNYLDLEPHSALTRGKFRMEQQVPAGATSLALRFQMQAGTGTASIAQMVVRNLTTLNAD